jgi:hypothetical protein
VQAAERLVLIKAGRLDNDRLDVILEINPCGIFAGE